MLWSPSIVELNPLIFIIQPTNVWLNYIICSIANLSFKAVYAATSGLVLFLVGVRPSFSFQPLDRFLPLSVTGKRFLVYLPWTLTNSRLSQLLSFH